MKHFNGRQSYISRSEYPLSMWRSLVHQGMKVLIGTIPLATLSCTFSATPDPTQLSSPNSAAIAKSTAELQVALIPWQSPEAQQEKLRPLSEYLEKQTGQKFNFQFAKDYQTAVDRLVEGKVDMAYLGPASYVQAKQRNPQIEPIVVPIDRTTGRPWYVSAIVANTDRGIRSLEDLKGKRFGFVSRSSTSGFLLASVALKERGIDPERDFASVKFSGSHDKAQTDLAEGIVDAIADDKPSFLRSQKAGKLSATRYKIIWESDPIPTGPIVVSAKVPSELVAQLKKALINAPVGLVDISGQTSAGYTLAKDSDFDSIRKAKARLEEKSGTAP